MLPDEFAHVFRMHGTAVFIDIGSVRGSRSCDHLHSEFLEDERGDIVRGSVGAVEDRFDPFQTAVVDGAFGEFDISAAGISAAGIAEPGISAAGISAAGITAPEIFTGGISAAELSAAAF